ncbi:hypothetical protein CC78DRAFT_339582 [Lojkania enalia]|uniref:Uncharacterized protein n=1 Tax=Lojkania enalia TaxID=147567 RepID=A0A9P4K4W3_9PLEO|nr:hypothetical protein CC78DRAFT_339582 [Didymosphaeria enalia]
MQLCGLGFLFLKDCGMCGFPTGFSPRTRAKAVYRSILRDDLVILRSFRLEVFGLREACDLEVWTFRDGSILLSRSTF